MDCFNIRYIIGCCIIIAILYLFRQWTKGARCQSTARLDGKTVIITGANSGIGKETAVDLAKRGATVVMACRDVKRGRSALKDVKERSGCTNVFLKVLDLASLASIHEFSSSFLTEYSHLHILINNAGVGLQPYAKTRDGFEIMVGVNHLGHFALTNLLLQRIVESAPSRIINVSSALHAGKDGTINFDDLHGGKKYDKRFAYCQSKLANILFTKELSRKLQELAVTVYSLHPGFVDTEIIRHLAEPIKSVYSFVIRYCCGKSAEEGAQTTIYCAVQEDIEYQCGMYFSDCAVKKSSKVSYDKGMAKKLWEISEEMTKVKFPL